MKWLDDAPAELKGTYPKEHVLKGFLGLLLCDPRMEKPWKKLSRNIETDDQWLRLWLAIKLGIGNARSNRKPNPAEDEADDLRWIAKSANELARVIEIDSRQRRGYKGYFNLPCHQFCPADVMKINGISGWDDIDKMKQYAAAEKLLREWPTMTELLDGLAAQATARASNVSSTRTVLKVKQRWAETMFIRTLHEHLNRYTWKSTDHIYVTIATITNMAIQAKLIKQEVTEEVTAKFVRNATT